MPATATLNAAVPETLFSGTHAYQAVNILAESINSVVFLATALPLHEQPLKTAQPIGAHERLVVLKKLPRALTACNELELHRRVHAHPNILPLLDYIITQDAIYLVLEYCPAGDLFDAILEVHEDPSLTQYQRERWAIRTFRELVHAIHWCHQQGIWHRDIKPENILLASDGHVQLTDFGLATEAAACTERGKGSLFYMAPELLASPAFPFGTGPVDSTQADIWSLGVLLLNMLGGRNPWPSASYHDDAFQVYLAYPDELRKAFNLTSDAWFVIERMLSIDPNFRPSIEDVLSWTDLVAQWIEMPVMAAPAAVATVAATACADDLFAIDAELEAAAAALAIEWEAETEAQVMAAMPAPTTTATVSVPGMSKSTTDVSDVLPTMADLVDLDALDLALDEANYSADSAAAEITAHMAARKELPLPSRCETYAPLLSEAMEELSAILPSSAPSTRAPSLTQSVSSESDEDDEYASIGTQVLADALPPSVTDNWYSEAELASWCALELGEPRSGLEQTEFADTVSRMSTADPHSKSTEVACLAPDVKSPIPMHVLDPPRRDRIPTPHQPVAQKAAVNPLQRILKQSRSQTDNFWRRLVGGLEAASTNARVATPAATRRHMTPSVLSSCHVDAMHPWPPYQRAGTPACA